jgi:alkylated DNA repair dioxygenase AlkB
LGLPYTYGTGAGRRTYTPKSFHGLVAELTTQVEAFLGCRFELCFLNGYASEREHLGWHADDSEEIDDGRPIAVMSLGAEREIWVRKRGERGVCEHKLLLPHGSLFVMGAGMQDTHDHRIPKAGRACGFRISLTWRGAA